MKPTVIQRKILLVFILPLTLALFVRAAMLFFLLDSPLSLYHLVLGLDMKAILILGSWLYHGRSIFTLYKISIAGAMFLNGGYHWPEAIIVLQMLLGAVGSLLTGWCVLRLTGNKVWAAMSGITAAIYAPGLMYECFIMKETFLTFFSLLALSALLWGRKRHFSKPAIFITGIFLALACLCRVTALPFCCLGGAWALWYCFNKLKRSKSWKRELTLRALCLGAGVAVLFVPVSIFNYFKGGTALPFYVKVTYAVGLGREETPTTMNVKPVDFSAPASGKASVTAGTFDFAINFLRKIPKVFSPYEIPNNLNYYFIRGKLFPINYLIGPLLLIPLALTAILLIIFSGRLICRESVLLAFILSFIFPICFFYPLARYRLVLYPVFCMLAPYPLFFAIRLYQRKKNLLLTSLAPVLCLLVLLLSIPKALPERSADYIAYGKALQIKEKSPIKALRFYKAAWLLSPENQAAVVNYTDALLRTGQPHQAGKVVIPALARQPRNAVYINYGVWACLAGGKPESAERLLRKTPVAIIGPIKYYSFLGEALRGQKKLRQAVAAYQKALASATMPQQKKMLENAIRNCLKNATPPQRGQH